MGYWIEVHCDVRSDTPNPARSPLNNGNVCYSFSNSNPSLMSVDAARAGKLVQREATRSGWMRKRIDGYLGWACPHCQKFPHALISSGAPNVGVLTPLTDERPDNSAVNLPENRPGASDG